MNLKFKKPHIQCKNNLTENRDKDKKTETTKNKDCCSWDILMEKGRMTNDFHNKNEIDRWIRFVGHRV